MNCLEWCLMPSKYLTYVVFASTSSLEVTEIEVYRVSAYGAPRAGSFFSAT